MINERERELLTAAKQLYDAYYNLPITLRTYIATIRPLDVELMKAQLAIKAYKPEMRAEAEQGSPVKFRNGE